MKYGRAVPNPEAPAALAPHKTPTRRAVLRGTGGVAIALPLLQSLLPRGAQAAVAGKRFVGFRTEHGGLDAANMVPGPSVANQTAALWHNVKYGSLLAGAQKSGGNTILSPVLTGSSAVLTDKLLGKMNVLMGFDIPMYLGHSKGAAFGNYGVSDQGPGDLRQFPTIDQVMAWSPKFYSSTAGVTQRSIVAGGNQISYGWSNPMAQSGSVQKITSSGSALELFDRLFAGVTPPPPGAVAPVKRKTVVDRLLNSYKSLRTSDRRLSMEDKRRLDDHVGALNELDRRLVQSSAPSTLTCSVKKPASLSTPNAGRGPAGDTAYHKTLNDVVAMALGCGVSRVANINVPGIFADYSGDWHQNVAHKHTEAGPQAMLAASNRLTFQATVLDLAAKLDAFEDSPGVSALDNSSVQWVQEAGIFTHDQHAMTVVSFGSAGGFFKTGQFVDYRSGRVDGYKQQYGIFYRQWLANTLLAMGIPASDFEFGNQPGYGDGRGGSGGRLYSPDIWAQNSKPLPLITNG